MLVKLERLPSKGVAMKVIENIFLVHDLERMLQWLPGDFNLFEKY